MWSSATTTPSDWLRKSSGAISARPFSAVPRSAPLILPRRISSEASSILNLRWVTFGSRPPATAAVAATTSSSPSRRRVIRALASTRATAPLDDRLQHPLQVGLPADRDRDLGRRLQPPDRAAQVVSVPPSVGDVTDRGEGHHAPVGGDGGERDLTRELAAVLPAGVEVEARPHRPRTGRVEVVLAVIHVTGPEPVRHQRLDRPAHQLSPSVSEDRLRAGVDELDLAVLVHAHHRVRGELE